MSILKIGILVHKTKLNKYGTQILLYRVYSSPVISYIKMRMSNQRNITATLVGIVCINNIINILLCFINACQLFIIKINEIKCVIKLSVKKITVVLIKQIGLCNIEQKLQIPN